MTPSFLQLCTVLFTVAMLCVSVYFLLGSMPLLILKHDTPVDGNFIRSFFNLYYRMAAFVDGAATLTYAFLKSVVRSRRCCHRGAIRGVAEHHHRQDGLASSQMRTDDIEAIPEFRKIHFRAVVAVVWSLFLFKL